MLRQNSSATILKLKFDKVSKKWGQIIVRYLKKNIEAAQLAFIATPNFLYFGFSSKSKTNKAILSIPSNNITNYHYDSSFSNTNINSSQGYLFCIDINVMKIFLSSTDTDIDVSVTNTEFKAEYTDPSNSYSFKVKLHEINQQNNIFLQQSLVSQCILTLNHSQNSIFQSVDSICHNFKCKQVSVNFDSSNKTLNLLLDNKSNTVSLGSVVKNYQNYLSEDKKYNAKFFTLGFTNLDKAEKLQLNFFDQSILFDYLFPNGMRFRYFLSEINNVDN